VSLCLDCNHTGDPICRRLPPWHVQLQGRVRSLEEELEQSHYELASLRAKHNEKMSQFKALEEANLQFEHKNKALQVRTALFIETSENSTAARRG